MTPSDREELDELAKRVTDLENLVDERLEPDTTQGPEEQHEAFKARIRARKGNR